MRKRKQIVIPNEGETLVAEGKQYLTLKMVKVSRWTSLIVATIGIAITLTIWLFPDVSQAVTGILSNGA